MRKLFICGALVGMAIAVGLVLTRVQEPFPSWRVVAAHPAVPAVPASPALGAAEEKERWASADKGVASVRAAYEHDAELLAFFQTALTSPENGGLYYAHRAWSDCYAIRTALAMPRTGPAIRQMLAEPMTRCGSLGDPATLQRLRGTLGTSALDRDPLMRAISPISGFLDGRKITVEAAQNAAKTAIAVGDAYMLADALHSLVQATSSFDGQVLDSESRGRMSAAIAIARCDLGVPCDDPVAIALNCPRDATECNKTLVVLALEKEPSVPYSDDERKVVLALADRLVSTARTGTLPGLFKA